jgi:hypothetical protein
MESATSPEFFPPLDRPVDRLDAMTRRVNSSRADTWARMKASSLLSLWLVGRPSRASRPLQQLRDTSCASSWWSPRRGRVHAAPAFGRSIHSAGLGGRRHRCAFAWVPLSLPWMLGPLRCGYRWVLFCFYPALLPSYSLFVLIFPMPQICT